LVNVRGNELSITSIVRTEPLAEGPGPLLELPLDEVMVGESIRTGGVDESHVGVLIETEGAWPPILVWGRDHHLVDGAHRLAAARRLGHRRILASEFVGTRQEALLEAVRSNTEHGLPLTMADRRAAASRLLDGNPEWSDRRVASACGLSGRTVAKIRRDLFAGEPAPGAPMPGAERRVGRDGKVRPVRPGEVRERIVEALRVRPEGSLREIAALAGASPETVRTVKAAQRADCDDSLPHTGMRGLGSSPGGRAAGLKLAALSSLPEIHRNPGNGRRDNLPAWSQDAALLACDGGKEFADWFSSNRIDEDWHRYLFSIPVGRIYEVVDEARQRAAEWTAFASVLESRIRGR
jgi:hypothetical protein